MFFCDSPILCFFLILLFHKKIIDFLCRYAKALHYKEQEFHQDQSPQVFEALILINNKLQQKEAAEGLLEFVMANRNAADELKVYEKFNLRLHVKYNNGRCQW